MNGIRPRTGRQQGVKISLLVIGVAAAAAFMILYITSLGQAASTMYIRNDSTGGDCSAIGNWDPASLTCTLNTDLTFTATNGVEVMNDGITLDGNGHSLTGTNSSGVYLVGRTGVTIKGLTIVNFDYGVNLFGSSSNRITLNTVSSSVIDGLYISGSSNDNVVHRNNFVANATQAVIDSSTGNIFDLAAPDGGNYWSDWTSPDADANGFVDSAYSFSGGADNLPFASQDGWVDTAAPVIGEVLPAGVIFATSTAVSATFSDSGNFSSGIDVSSVNLNLDGVALGDCTTTATSISCPANALGFGSHAIGGSVSDNAGNSSSINGTFSVGDDQSPQLSYNGPSGAVNDPTPDVTATYSDADPSSGINETSATLSLNGGAAIVCSAVAGTIICNAGPLADGHYTALVSISDNSGNAGTVSGAFDLDSSAPQVSNVAPSGNIYTDTATISADYGDSASGINLASANLTLDGAALVGCTVTAVNISCPVSNLAFTAHTIGGSVSDSAGNSTPISGSFNVVDNQVPQLAYTGPGGIIGDSTPTVSATYGDPDPSSGVNQTSATLSLNGGPSVSCAAVAGTITCDAGPLTDGHYSALISISDNYGNTGSANGAFDVDASGPQVSNVAPSGNISTTEATISADYTDAVSGINNSSANLTLDGVPLTGCTITATNIGCPVTGLTFGVHTIGGSVADNMGQTSPISGSFNVVDSQPPQLNYTGPSGNITDTTPTITATYSDPGLSNGVNEASATLSLNGGTATPCTAGGSVITCQAGPLADGHFAVVVSITDNAGNTGAASSAFDLDTSAPQVSNVIPAGNIYTTSAAISADYTDSGSGINQASATLSLDGVTLSGCAVSAANISCPVTGLTFGAHTISGSVADNNGFSSPISGSFSVGDNQAPQLGYTGASGNTNETTPTISATYSDPLPSAGVNQASATVTLNGGQPTACAAAAGVISCATGPLADGHYTALISISDNSGNTGTVTGIFDLDATAPQVSNVLPAGNISANAATVSADYIDTGAGINTASANLTLDGVALTGCTVTASNIGCPVTGLTFGAHTIGGSVADTNSNVSTISGSFSVVDTEAPQLSYTGPSGNISDTTPAITATYADPGLSSGINEASATLSLNGGPPTSCTAAGGTITCAAGPLTDGHYDALIAISDNSGNAGTANGSFDLDASGPQVSNVLPAGNISTTSATISADYTDTGAGIDQTSSNLTLDGAALTGCSVTATNINCPVTGLSLGAHTIGGSVSDNNGTISPITGSFSVVDTEAPQLSYTGPTGPVSDSTPSVTATYSEADPSAGINPASATLSLNGGAPTACMAASGIITCEAGPLADGHYAAVISMSDNAGNTASIGGAFDLDATGPQVSNVTPTGDISSASATISASYVDSGSGVNPSSASLTLDGAPLTGCSAMAANISCPATGLGFGVHTIGGSVADNNGNVSTISGSFRVVDNQPPQLTYTAPNDNVSDNTPIITATYIDPELSSGVNEASGTLSLNGGTATACTAAAGMITCQAGPLADGQYNAVISISDNFANTGTTSGSFTLDATGPVVSNVLPTGEISTPSATVSANFVDLGSGVNLSSASLTLDGVRLTGCTATPNSMSCPVTNLTLGSHTIGGSVADNNGNVTPISGGFAVVDKVAPQITSVRPAGTIMSDTTTIVVTYSDNLSGVNTSSVNIKLDGIALPNCVATQSEAKCDLAGLEYGVHVISGSVSDNSGNAALISGIFDVYTTIDTTGSPHGGYGTENAPMDKRTDLCLSCHDVHNSQGDYALMREETVTATCGTCHAVFGAQADNTWTEPPPNLPDGQSEAAVSPRAVYENVAGTRESGHRLGVSWDPATPDLVSDVIPGSDTDQNKETDDPLTLRNIISQEYGATSLYVGGSVLEQESLRGLYCGSCHTPHGSVGGVDTDGNGMPNQPIPVNSYDVTGNVTSQAYMGDQLVIDDCPGLPLNSDACAQRQPNHVKPEKLISSNPNHLTQRTLMNEDANGNGVLDTGEDTLIANGKIDSFMAPVTKPSSYNDWCLTCHNRQWNGTEWNGSGMQGTPGVSNHPPLCVSCHSKYGGDKGLRDFPHTSGNEKLLAKDKDGLCIMCHDLRRLP